MSNRINSSVHMVKFTSKQLPFNLDKVLVEQGYYKDIKILPKTSKLEDVQLHTVYRLKDDFSDNYDVVIRTDQNTFYFMPLFTLEFRPKQYSLFYPERESTTGIYGIQVKPEFLKKKVVTMREWYQTGNENNLNKAFMLVYLQMIPQG